MSTVSPALRVVGRADGLSGSNVVPPLAGSHETSVSTDAQPAPQAQAVSAAFPGPLVTTDVETIEGLARVFDAHRLNQTGLNEALGQAAQRLDRADIPLYERRLAAPTPLNTLLKLFTLRLWIEEPAACEAFAPVSLERLSALGVLETGAKGVRARVALSFCEDLWLFHDEMVDSPKRLRPDHVLGTNPAALTLANLTVRAPADCALDVGTGCGVQALLAAKHCRKVIASDTNPRALNYTQFNARLNRRPNVECQLGSLFEPVAGSKFDLIVCNPPFVISPESEYLFRDSGLPADQLSEQVVRAAPGLLNEGGFASILCSWAHWEEEDWSARPRGWTADNACDVYVFRGKTEDPLGHAALWNEGYDPAAFARRLDLWQEYYQKLGIKALTVGAVVLRRRSAGGNWTRTDELPQRLVGSCSAHILRVTEAEDFLSGLSGDEALFDRVFTLPPDHCLHQTMVHEPGKFVIQKMELELQGGLRFVGKLDAASFQMLKRCDGQRTLRSIVTELAGIGKASFEQIRDQAGRVAREIIRCGFLVPIPGTRAAEASPSDGGPGVTARSNSAPGASPGETYEG